jgi:hypothetical protein
MSHQKIFLITGRHNNDIYISCFVLHFMWLTVMDKNICSWSRFHPDIFCKDWRKLPKLPCHENYFPNWDSNWGFSEYNSVFEANLSLSRNMKKIIMDEQCSWFSIIDLPVLRKRNEDVTSTGICNLFFLSEERNGPFLERHYSFYFEVCLEKWILQSCNRDRNAGMRILKRLYIQYFTKTIGSVLSPWYLQLLEFVQTDDTNDW